MAYNPQMYFPQQYQPMQPMYPQMQPPVQQPQSRIIEVVPVDTEDAAVNYPVAVGATQVMFARDDSFIAVKSNGMNGQSGIDIYDKRPPAPPAPKFDPTVYVRRDEINELVAKAMASQMEAKHEPV